MLYLGVCHCICLLIQCPVSTISEQTALVQYRIQRLRSHRSHGVVVTSALYVKQTEVRPQATRPLLRLRPPPRSCPFIVLSVCACRHLLVGLPLLPSLQNHVKRIAYEVADVGRLSKPALACIGAYKFACMRSYTPA